MHRTHPCPLCRHDAQWAGMAVEHDGSPGAARITETETYFCRVCGHLWEVLITARHIAAVTPATQRDRADAAVPYRLTV